VKSRNSVYQTLALRSSYVSEKVDFNRRGVNQKGRFGVYNGIGWSYFNREPQAKGI